VSRPEARWWVAVALLCAEYLALSFLVDLPLLGPALPLASAVRVAVPVLIGAFAAVWIISAGDRAAAWAPNIPPWRPWPALAAQPVAFLATALVARAVLRDGAPPPSAGALGLLLGCAAVAALLALRSAVPLSWFRGLITRRWGMPLVALGLGGLAWRVATAVEAAWGVLSAGTLSATAWALGLFSVPVTVVPAQSLIGAGDFLVVVTPACSGADGLGLVLLFQAAWISLARGRLRVRHALVLLPIGALLALSANVLRLSILLLVGAFGHPDLATGALHSKLGWILFIAIALGTVALAERARWIQRPVPEPGGLAGGVPVAAGAYLGPLLAALATALVTSSLSESRFDPWYAARIIAGGGTLLAVRRALPRASFSWSWASVAIGLAVGAVWVAFGGAELAPADAPLAARSHPGWPWIAARLVFSCALVPVLEELAFRGFLLRWLVSPDFEHAQPQAWTWQAVALSSVAFGALHAEFLLGTASGVAFAGAYLRRGRLADAVLAHALANAAIAVAVLRAGRWDLW